MIFQEHQISKRTWNICRERTNS